METVRQAYQRSREFLNQIYPEGEAGVMSDRLFEDKFGLNKNAILVNAIEIFDRQNELDTILGRLKLNEPLQHIIGFEFFSGLKIRVGPDVLIPRPETEELLHWVFSDLTFQPMVIADICTGSGCIAMALKSKYPQAEIYATDISGDSLEMASKSEKDNFDLTSIRWIKHDLLSEIWSSPSPDLIVCNPPYIRLEESVSMHNNVLDYEPHRALFVYDLDPLLFYKRVLTVFAEKKIPTVYFELNPFTAKELKLWCEQQQFTCEIRKDMSGKERFARITG